MGILWGNLTEFFSTYKWIWVYLIGINLITFIFFAADKMKAIRGKWRISEAVLLGLSFIGGSIGGLLAMKIFNHKNKKAYFSWGLPIMLFIHIVIILYISWSLF